nr:hypothetical protein GCM10020093_065500 [Planobispora longispora]
MAVLAVEAAHAGEVIVVGDGISGLGEAAGPGVEILDQEGGVGLAGGTEVGLDSEMQLDAVPPEPAPAPRGEHRGLGDLGQAEHTRIELSECGLTPGRTGQLDVVQHRNLRRYLHTKIL